MQKKAVVLAIAGLISGGAFADTYVSDIDSVIVQTDTNDGSAGSFYVEDYSWNNGYRMNTISSDTEATTIQTEGTGSLTVSQPAEVNRVRTPF